MITTNRQAILSLHPHYSDDRFSMGQTHTIYLAAGYELSKDRYPTVKMEGIEYNYSDRIWQWNWHKAADSHKLLQETYPQWNTAEAVEAWLRLYWDAPQLELVHILVGVNVSNGYAYQVFGYIRHNEKKEITE